MNKPVVCWCPVCNESHYLYKECGHWFVYNCPHFLSYHHLQNHVERLKQWATGASKKGAKKGAKSKLAQYPGTQKPAKPIPFKAGDRVVFKQEGDCGTIEKVYHGQNRIAVRRDDGRACECGPEHIKLKKKNKKRQAPVTHKKPKTHWHVDIEDISTGEL